MVLKCVSFAELECARRAQQSWNYDRRNAQNHGRHEPGEEGSSGHKTREAISPTSETRRNRNPISFGDFSRLEKA